MKRFFLAASFLVVLLSAQAVTRDTLCARYGLTPGSEDFRRCVHEPQSKSGAISPKSPVTSNTTPLNTDVSNLTPIQTDIGKLVVVFQPDADAHYPSFSKRSGEQGTVVVRLIIDQAGFVEDVALLQSSTFPRLDRAAADIGRNYRFKPFLVNGKPAKISTNLLIKFNLKMD